MRRLSMLVAAFMTVAGAHAADFDGAAPPAAEEALSLKMPPASPADKPEPKKKGKAALVQASAKAFAPVLVREVSAFSLTPEQLAEAAKGVPAPDSPTGLRLQEVMRQAFVADYRQQKAFKGTSLKVITWNINAAHTKEAVAAVLGVADNDPAAVQDSLGRKSGASGKAVDQMSRFSDNDVFLIQEIPLPTAVELAKHLKTSVFWAPEFVEVGDNAKGRDPRAGDIYTGNAILSRVDLSDYRVIRFSNQADWYQSQKGPQPLGDKLTKIAAKTLFAADPGNPHQTRPGLPYGGRIGMFARTSASYRAQGVSGKDIWVGNLHLEDLSGIGLTGPELRRAQMAEARGFIDAVDGPVLFGGDLNTMGNSPGVIEGEDLATEGPNAMHPGQPPVDRQRGLAAGVGTKFFGAVDAGNLATTLLVNPGGSDTILKRDKDGKIVETQRSRRKLALEQTIPLAMDVAPYAPTVHDAVGNALKIKEQPKNVPRDLWYAGMTAADFFPYTAVGAKGFQIFWDERSRHNPTAKANADHNLFTDAKKDGAEILNPKLGFRFGMGGYPATWTAGRPMMIPGLSKGLANAVVDWLFVRDPAHQVQARGASAEVMKEMVIGTKAGNSDAKRLSDHYPLRAEIPLTP